MNTKYLIITAKYYLEVMMESPNEKKRIEIDTSVQDKIQEVLCQINNGSVTIIKQNNAVVQINLVEKLKLV